MDSNFAKKGVTLVGKNIVTGKSSYKMPKNHISGKGESQEEKPALIVSKPGYYGFLLSMILPREGRRKLVSLSKCDNYPSKKSPQDYDRAPEEELSRVSKTTAASSFKPYEVEAWESQKHNLTSQLSVGKTDQNDMELLKEKKTHGSW